MHILCPICHAVADLLGQLGIFYWFLCPDCGIEFYRGDLIEDEIPFETTPDPIACAYYEE